MAHRAGMCARRAHRCLFHARTASYSVASNCGKNEAGGESDPAGSKCGDGGVRDGDDSDPAFWRDANCWQRARANTLRCLVGCTIGDFGALFALQAYYPALGTAPTVALAMVSGVATSLALETAVLRWGVERMPLRVAAQTAARMSLASMLSMEAAENAVDLVLTGGVLAPGELWWWAALAPSIAAGFLVPLPYNYYMLKKYGRSCH